MDISPDQATLVNRAKLILHDGNADTAAFLLVQAVAMNN